MWPSPEVDLSDPALCGGLLSTFPDARHQRLAPSARRNRSSAPPRRWGGGMPRGVHVLAATGRQSPRRRGPVPAQRRPGGVGGAAEGGAPAGSPSVCGGRSQGAHSTSNSVGSVRASMSSRWCSAPAGTARVVGRAAVPTLRWCRSPGRSAEARARGLQHPGLCRVLSTATKPSGTARPIFAPGRNSRRDHDHAGRLRRPGLVPGALRGSAESCAGRRVSAPFRPWSTPVHPRRRCSYVDHPQAKRRLDPARNPGVPSSSAVRFAFQGNGS